MPTSAPRYPEEISEAAWPLVRILATGIAAKARADLPVSEIAERIVSAIESATHAATLNERDRCAVVAANYGVALPDSVHVAGLAIADKIRKGVDA